VTYNVFGGMLNLTEPNAVFLRLFVAVSYKTGQYWFL